jgi:UDP-glucose:(heptosyl)LPS alpha-1,3-glucosyltransferase
MRIIQIVRRFGPVGGLEGYAWQLTRALAARGFAVAVVCETDESEPIDGVPVTVLGRMRPKPRWLHYLRFARRVAVQRELRGQKHEIWHSHEMVTCAEVGTFHSTAHGAGERALHKRLDPTWHINRWLERRTMAGAALRAMVPVSAPARQQLASAHPRWASRLADPIRPGVDLPKLSVAREVGPVMGFIGREWKRKGLPRVLEMLRAMPDARLVIAGVPRKEIARLLEGLEDRVELLGWIDDPADFYKRIRLLVHPAKLEAYGMVVAEALARRIPVLVSEATGASADMGTAGRALPHTAPVQPWAAAAREMLAQSPEKFPPIRSWAEVAEEYHLLYQRLTL